MAFAWLSSQPVDPQELKSCVGCRPNPSHCPSQLAPADCDWSVFCTSLPCTALNANAPAYQALFPGPIEAPFPLGVPNQASPFPLGVEEVPWGRGAGVHKIWSLFQNAPQEAVYFSLLRLCRFLCFGLTESHRSGWLPGSDPH